VYHFLYTCSCFFLLEFNEYQDLMGQEDKGLCLIPISLSTTNPINLLYSLLIVYYIYSLHIHCSNLHEIILSSFQDNVLFFQLVFLYSCYLQLITFINSSQNNLFKVKIWSCWTQSHSIVCHGHLGSFVIWLLLSSTSISAALLSCPYVLLPSWVIVLNQEWFLSPGYIWQCVKTLSVSHNRGSTFGIQWVESSDAIKHLIMQRIASHNKEWFGPKCQQLWG
jgi:hypothetical protein